MRNPHELPRVGSRIMDERILRLRAQGRHILNLSAYPHRRLPEAIVRQAQDTVRELAHPPARGLLGLRDGLARYLERETGVSLDPEREILITSGAMHALLCIALASVQDGDEVLIPTPSYFFDGHILLAGGAPRHILMPESEHYIWDIDRLQAGVTAHTRGILLCNPVNPTGHVPSGEEIDAVVRLAQERGLWILSDESYDRLVYDGLQHRSLLNPKYDRQEFFIIRSFTKSFGMANWRVAAVAASADWIDRILKVFEWSMLFGSLLSQTVAELVIRSDLAHLSGLADEFKRNRDHMSEAFATCPDISYVKPQGAPFFFVNVQALGSSDDRITDVLLEQYGIPCTPGYLHGETGHIRIPFGGDPVEIEEAVRRIPAAIHDLRVNSL